MDVSDKIIFGWNQSDRKGLRFPKPGPARLVAILKHV